MNPLPKTAYLIEQQIAAGDQLGTQLFASRDGQVIADLAIGQARPGANLTADDLLPWMSAGKPLAVVVMAQLVERGLVEFDEPVVRYIPEFGAGGKSPITIRHVLTHTGGFRLVGNNWSSESWEQIIDRICVSKLEPGWVPGEKAGYHVASGWFILGELIRRIDGRTFDRIVREDLLEPIGAMDSWVGMPQERFDAYGGFDGRIGLMYSTDKPPPIAKGMVNTPAGCTECRPGANARGPVRELARFYQMLLNGGEIDGHRVLSADMVHTLTRRQRVGMMDETFKHIIDWGYGFIINSRRYGNDHLPYGFGTHASDDTFGHGGNQSSCGLADSKHGLVVTWVCNGMPGEIRHDRRVRAINSAVYEDLGLA